MTRSSSNVSYSSKKEIAATTIVIALGFVQYLWMGPAILILSTGLALSLWVWAAGGWRASRKVLPLYLTGISVQCLHFGEEYLMDFQREFPALLGYEWSDQRYVSFNLLWLCVFVAAAAGVSLGVRVSYLIVLFYGLIGGVGNGVGHVLISLTRGEYFPGLATAPLCLVAGVLLLRALFRGSHS